MNQKIEISKKPSSVLFESHRNLLLQMNIIGDSAVFRDVMHLS